MKPTIGRIVHYTLTQENCEAVKEQRKKWALSGHYPEGVQSPLGNAVHPGDIIPAIVTAVWTETTINAKGFLDGFDSLWLSSIQEGPQGGNFSGNWNWPPRVKE